MSGAGKEYELYSNYRRVRGTRTFEVQGRVGYNPNPDGLGGSEPAYRGRARYG